MKFNGPVILGIDLGTSGTRGIAFSKEGRPVAQAYEEFPSSFPEPGWVEQDGRRQWQTTLRILRRIIRRLGPGRIAGIGLTNQRETTLLWDRRTGQPVAPAIVWQDQRTEAICRRFKRHEPIIRRKTGLILHPYFSASKIVWLLEQTPGLAARVRRGEICFGTPDVWLLWNLTGGAVFATEPSNASRTLLFDIRTLRFDPELLRLFGLTAVLFPEVKPSDSFFGLTSKKVLGCEIPIHSILGDQQASLFAHGLWEPGLAKNTYGTGLFLVTHTGGKLVRAPGLLTTIAWSLEGRKTAYALEGSVLMGGSVLTWLRDRLGLLKDYSEAEAMARSMKDNEGVYFVPALQGLGAPFWDSGARGLITGLTRRASRETLVRAALESMAYQSRDVLEVMGKALGRTFQALRVDGGGASNDFLMQFQADLLGIPVERPAVLETTALGVAALSGIASGFWTRESFQKHLRIEKRWKPRMPRAQRERLYGQWRAAQRKSFKGSSPP